MTATVTDRSERATHHAEHEIVVDAPARESMSCADVQGWPLMFDLTVHGEIIERDGQDERIRIWSATNDAARTWTSRRHHDLETLTIGFHPDKTKAPIGGMTGAWVVEALTDGTCRLRILHDFFPATDDPADVDWINNALDRNTGVELAKVKARAESLGSPLLLTFAESVEVDGSAKDVYDFLNEAQLWKERLPHVSRVSLEEAPPACRSSRRSPDQERSGAHRPIRTGLRAQQKDHLQADRPAPAHDGAHRPLAHRGALPRPRLGDRRAHGAHRRVAHHRDPG